MSTAVDQALAELRAEREQLSTRLHAFDRALEVLEQIAGGEPARARSGAAIAKGPKKPSPRAPPPGRLELIKARAGGTARSERKLMPSSPEWTCKACGQKGHSARSKSCPKKAGGKGAKRVPYLSRAHQAEDYYRCRLPIAIETGKANQQAQAHTTCGGLVFGSKLHQHLVDAHGIQTDEPLEHFDLVESEPTRGSVEESSA